MEGLGLDELSIFPCKAMVIFVFISLSIARFVLSIKMIHCEEKL